MNKEGTLGFLMGLGAGVALVLYCAPRARSEAGRLLAKKTKAGTGAVQQWRDKANEMVKNGRAEIARQQEGVLNAVEAGKTAYREATV